MSIRKASPGSLVRPRGSTWNMVAGAAERVLTEQQLHGQGGFSRKPIDFGIIPVKNTTSLTINRYGIVTLDEPLMAISELDDWQNTRVWKAVNPLADDPWFGVLTRTAEPGEIVDCVMNGLIHAQVNVVSESHPYAKPIATDNTKLESTWDPIGATIIHVASGTGTKWAWVRVGGHYRESTLTGVTAETIAVDSSGDVTIWQSGATTSTTVTAHLDWMHGNVAVTSGKECLVRYFIDTNEWRIVAAECE